MSETVVKTHITQLLRKFNLRDRAQADVLAYESGLLEPTRGSKAAQASAQDPSAHEGRV